MLSDLKLPESCFFHAKPQYLAKEAWLSNLLISPILKTYKKEYSIIKIREIIGTDMYGTTVKGIVQGLEKEKFDVKAVRVELEDFNNQVTLPAIL